MQRLLSVVTTQIKADKAKLDLYAVEFHLSREGLLQACEAYLTSENSDRYPCQYPHCDLTRLYAPLSTFQNLALLLRLDTMQLLRMIYGTPFNDHRIFTI